ncbi:HAD family hydrolase [Nitrosopumilus sp.]|uniref:HAD family hydrolase n=1 Tax=Nitrosopumilus sp. TaxID=2024843 RepID=UPI003D09ADD1
MTKTKCVLFDIGGVLVDWHMSWITSEVSKRFGIKEDLIVDAFDKHLSKLDSGKIHESDFWYNVAVDTESDLLKNNKESLWDTYFRKNAIPNPDVKKLSINLKQNGFTIGIISNIEKVTHTVVDDWDMLSHFEHKFMSYQIGFSKPDPRIYEHVIQKLPYSADELLFIDDKPSNVESAKNCGMPSIHFTDLDNLQSSLEEFEVTI